MVSFSVRARKCNPNEFRASRLICFLQDELTLDLVRLNILALVLPCNRLFDAIRCTKLVPAPRPSQGTFPAPPPYML